MNSVFELSLVIGHRQVFVKYFIHSTVKKVMGKKGIRLADGHADGEIGQAYVLDFAKQKLRGRTPWKGKRLVFILFIHVFRMVFILSLYASTTRLLCL